MDEYESEGENESESPNVGNLYSTEVLQLLQKLDHPAVIKAAEEEVCDFPVSPKIFFASRTHSQLSQFAKEVKKVKFPKPSWLGRREDWTANEEDKYEPIRLIPLASRKNLCIHPIVSKLHPEALNEACLDLQDPKVSASKRCKYLSTDDASKQTFRNHALAEIRDIEELVVLGQKLQVCPYYSSRLAINPSEIVTLPYPLLLNKTARQSLGIDLHNNVVIIDEAHNLIDAINDVSSALVSVNDLKKCEVAIGSYLAKFNNRLKGKNKMYIEQLLSLTSRLRTFLSTQTGGSRIYPSDLLPKGGDAVNIHKLVKYLKISKLARKVDGFVQILDASSSQQGTKSTPVVNVVQRFLECLVNPANEGVFFCETLDPGEMALKYMLLDPSYAFSEIVEDARSIVLAGGTMEPLSDFLDMLFSKYLSRIKTFSCGHVIPKKNLTALVLASGPTNKRFDFTFAHRQDSEMLKDLGRAIANFIVVIPDGVVVFFGSYSYLSFVLKSWADSGIEMLLAKRKPIFTESKDLPVDQVLGNYTASIDAGKGGILFAVVGGKMSEGINFSDALGRAVIMIGLPFPNANTPEWQAKLAYVEKSAISRFMERGMSRTDAADQARICRQQHYENMTMRAVNQSIGRAIRHKNDYASILLIDHRYGTETISNKLPGWIRAGLQPGVLAFSGALQFVGQFFRQKRSI